MRSTKTNFTNKNKATKVRDAFATETHSRRKHKHFPASSGSCHSPPTAARTHDATLAAFHCWKVPNDAPVPGNVWERQANKKECPHLHVRAAETQAASGSALPARERPTTPWLLRPTRQREAWPMPSSSCLALQLTRSRYQGGLVSKCEQSLLRRGKLR